MSTLSKQLAQCHRLRQHLRDLHSEIDRAPKVLAAQKAKLTQEEAKHQQAQDALKKLKVTLHEREITLKQTDAQLKKYERQLDEVSNQREYDSKRNEIANAKARIDQLETEILEGLAQLDEQTAALPALAERVAQAREAFAQFEQAQQKRIASLTEEVGIARAKLAQAEAELPANIRPLYDRLVKAYGPDGLAAIRDNACTYCNTALNHQTVSSVQAGQFVCCSSCGRGLYAV
jgi:predicted  nucleic acid-binding Zn-ribbon protein